MSGRGEIFWKNLLFLSSTIMDRFINLEERFFLFLCHPALPHRLPYTPCYVVKLVELQRTSIAVGAVKEEELWPVVFGGGSEWTWRDLFRYLFNCAAVLFLHHWNHLICLSNIKSHWCHNLCNCILHLSFFLNQESLEWRIVGIKNRFLIESRLQESESNTPGH